MFELISINWIGQPFTDEQLLVMRNVAAQHLRMRKKQATIHFKHPLCEGELTRKKRGALVRLMGRSFMPISVLRVANAGPLIFFCRAILNGSI